MWGLEWDSKPGIGNNRFLHNTISNNSLGVVFSDGPNDTLINNIIAYNYRQNDPDYPQIRHRSRSDFNSITIESNIIFPRSKRFNTKNFNMRPEFSNASNGLFFLKKRMKVRPQKTKDCPTKDFFGNEYDDPNQLEIGCFSYDPNLLEMGRIQKWHMGWPYYFRKTGNVIPDLWEYPSSKTDKGGHQ
jgi:hypothetical protein